MYRNNFIVYFLGYLIQSFTITSLLFYTQYYIARVTADPQILNFLNLMIAIMMIVMFISKPVLAIISDLFKFKAYFSRKSFLFIGYLGFLPTFVLTIIFYKQIVLAIACSFGVLIFLSFIDVAIDGNIIDSSNNSRSLNIKIVLTLSGYSAGVLLSSLMLIEFAFYGGMNFQIILVTLIGVISLFLFDGRIANGSDLKDKNSSVKKPWFFPSAKYVKLFIITAIGLFLYSLVELINDNRNLIYFVNFSLTSKEYAIISLLTYIFNILGYAGALITAGIFNKPKRSLFALIPILVVINIILNANLGFGIIGIHFVLTLLISVLGGFILVFLTSLMMDFSKDKMSFKFQTLNIIGSVTYFLLHPVGNIWLSSLGLYLLSSTVIGIFSLLILIPIIIIELKPETIIFSINEIDDDI